MDRFSIENFIKKQIKGHQEHIDKDELWDSLGLESQKKDRQYILWILCCLFVLISGIVVYTLLQNDNASQAGNIEIEKNIKVEHNPETKVKTEKPSVLDKNILALSDENTELNKEDKNTNQNSTTRNQDTSVSQKATTESKKKVTTTQTKTTHVVTQTQNIATDNRSQENVKTALLNSNNPTALRSHFISQSSTAPIDTKTEYRQYAELQIGSLHSLFFDLDQKSKNSDPIENLESHLINTEKRQSKKQSLIPYVEYGTLKRTLTANMSGSANYVERRNQLERPLDYFLLGLKYEKNIHGNLSGSIGLTFTQLSEQMNYSLRDTVEVERDGTTIFTDYQGNVTSTTINGIGLDIHEENWIYQNQIRIVEVPIVLHYSLLLNRWSINPEVGLALRILADFDGEIINRNQIIVSNPSSLDTGVGMSWSAAVSINYQLTERYDISLAPIYRRHLGNFTSDTEVRQSYQTLGGRLSLKMNL